MHTTVRIYRSPELADALIERRSAVAEIIRKIPGFLSYQLVRTPEGAVTITTCESESGCEQSTQAAREYVSQNLPQFGTTVPDVLSGKAAISFGSTRAGV